MHEIRNIVNIITVILYMYYCNITVLPNIHYYIIGAWCHVPLTSFSALSCSLQIMQLRVLKCAYFVSGVMFLDTPILSVVSDRSIPNIHYYIIIGAWCHIIHDISATDLGYPDHVARLIYG